MAIDPTLAQPQFHPWSDEERRTAALKIVEQLRENKRLAADLKDGKDRLKKLLAQFQAGGEERDAIEDQPELPFDGDGDMTAHPPSLVDSLPTGTDLDRLTAPNPLVAERLGSCNTLNHGIGHPRGPSCEGWRELAVTAPPLEVTSEPGEPDPPHAA